MRLILQRVTSARVRVEGEVVGQIGSGLLVLAGVEKGDGGEQVERAAEKLATLRVFGDDDGKMNLDLAQIGGQILLVSQFTLAASTRKGRRPSFDQAAPPAVAEALLAELGAALERRGAAVETGRFGAYMEVELVNDGPVTFLVEV